MKYDFQVKVKVAPRIYDPQAVTIEKSLRKLSYPVRGLRMGKIFEISIEAPSEERARSIAEEIAAKVLSNPVFEVYELEMFK
ncbi:MAG: phosphoribosylformylglycinamidine synthase subunit PurS [Caldiserica bacterium]|jgi:phosphoribosylformylglycinamidine synthase|nr:phosphoribosylformylglycinamidine synthase subunit PurS [Caldisericota bacterium]